MSQHLPHRLTTMHYAMSLTLLCSVSFSASLPTAQAAVIGKTSVLSAQHEPLIASITLTDIKSSNFSAHLANPIVYQQMGLTPTASMIASFVASSATTGQIIINTTQPISMPFADVVLNLNDNGARRVIPKTLLMPIGNNVTSHQPDRLIATVLKETELPPIVSVNPVTPLLVKRVSPPLLFTAPILEAQPLIVKYSAPPLLNTSKAQVSAQALTMQTTRLQAINTQAMSKQTSDKHLPRVVQSHKPVPTRINKQLDTLNIRVARSINIRNRKIDLTTNTSQEVKLLPQVHLSTLTPNSDNSGLDNNQNKTITLTSNNFNADILTALQFSNQSIYNQKL